ncbi:hypothetical protein ABK040_009252 [Willaertia magna]
MNSQENEEEAYWSPSIHNSGGSNGSGRRLISTPPSSSSKKSPQQDNLDSLYKVSPQTEANFNGQYYGMHRDDVRYEEDQEKINGARDDQHSTLSSILFETPGKNNNEPQTISKLTHHIDELKVENEMWRKAYRELQSKHTQRVDTVLKEYKQKEEELREKFEEEKSSAIKTLSRSSYIVQSDMKNLIFLLKNHNVDNLYEVINTEQTDQEYAKDPFINTFNELKNCLFSRFRELTDERNELYRENKQLSDILETEKESLIQEVNVFKSEHQGRFNQELQSLREQLHYYQKKAESMEGDQDRIQVDYEQRLIELQQQNKELESLIETERNSKKSLEESIDTLKYTLAERDVQLEQTKTHAQQQVSLLESKLKIKQTELDEMSESLSRIKNHNQRVQEDSSEKLDEFKKEIKSLRETVGQYKLKYGEENQKSYFELARELDSAYQKIKQIEDAKIQQLDELVETYEFRLNQMQEVIQESHRIIDLESKKTETVQKQQQSTTLALERLERILIEKSIITKPTNDLSLLVDKVIEYITIREQQLSTHFRELEVIRTKLDESENNRQLLKKDLEGVISNLQSKLGEDIRLREEEKKRFESLILSLEEKVKHAKESKETNELNLEQSRQLNRLQLELNEKEKVIQSANNTIRSLKENMELSSTNLDYRQKQMEELLNKKEEEIKRVRSDLTTEIDHYKKRLRRLSVENETMQNKLREAELTTNGERRKSFSEVEMLNVQLREQHEKIESLNIQLSKQYLQIREQVNIIETLRKEKDSLSSQINLTNNTDKVIEEQIARLTEHYNAEIGKYREKHEQLSKKYKNLKEKFFRQSLRQNELQSYLLKLQKKQQKKQNEQEESILNQKPPVKLAPSNPSVAPSVHQSEMYSHIHPSTSTTYPPANDHNEENYYPRYIVTHPSSLPTSNETSPNPHNYYVDNEHQPTFYQPISSISINTKTKPSSSKIVNSRNSLASNATNAPSISSTKTKKKKKTSKPRSQSNGR